MLWERAICITLEGCEERQRGIAGLPFPVDFFYGADLRAGLTDPAVYDDKRRQQYGRKHLTPAEIGCAISHREVARTIAESGKRTLVVEDDVSLIGKIPRVAPHFNLSYLGYQAMNLDVPLGIRLKLALYYPLKGNAESVRRIYAADINHDWWRAGWFNGAYAYVLDPTAAQYIVELQGRIWLEADTALSYLCRFSRLSAIAMKRPIFQVRDDLASLIGERPSWS